jgi:hypothetical protein
LRDITDYFAAARGVADVDGVLEVEKLDQFRAVGGVGIHVIAEVGLGGSAMAATIMRDDPVALG